MRTDPTIAVLLALALTAGCTPGSSAPPQQQIDVAGIRAELLAIGQAEGHYLVSHSRYATLEELQQDTLLAGGADRRGYRFTAAVDGSQGYTITAIPTDPEKQAWPTLVMNQTMQILER
jgi:hypothetical protein